MQDDVNPKTGRKRLLTGDTKSQVGQVSSGELAAQVNPELRNRIAASQADLTQQYNRQVLPGISRAAEQSGRYGSDAHQLAQGEAATGLTRALGDVESGMQFQDYNARMQDMMQGLGLGTQIMGIESQQQADERLSRLAGLNNLRDQEQFNQQMDFNRAQLGQQGDLASMGMMADLANMFGGQQQNALGNLPGLDQMGGMGFLSNLLGQSTGLDSAAINAILGQQGLGLQRQGLQQDQQRINLAQQAQQYGQQADAFGFMNQNPWDQLQNFGQLVSGLTGQYGTSTGTGNTHSTQPYMGPDPWGAALQGAVGGYNLAGGGYGGGGNTRNVGYGMG